MRIGLVVDSACDLPQSFIEEHKIKIMPISIRIDDELIVDVRDSQQLLEFHQRHIGDKDHDAESVPFTVEQIKELFLKEVVADFDYAICQTVTSTRSPIFENATKASFQILKSYKPIREAAGVAGPFALRVINSRTLFTGQAVLAAETIRLIRAGTHINEIRSQVEALARRIYAYLVPPDLYYLRDRARKKGDKSVGWVAAFLGTALDLKPIMSVHDEDTFPVAKIRGFETAVEKMFDHATKKIQEGLLAPFVSVSYAGDPQAIPSMPGYDRLSQAAAEQGYVVLNSLMSMTGGVNTGPGSICLGFAAPEHEFGK